MAQRIFYWGPGLSEYRYNMLAATGLQAPFASGVSMKTDNIFHRYLSNTINALITGSASVLIFAEHAVPDWYWACFQSVLPVRH